MTRTKKGKKLFALNNFFHSKKKVFNKEFENLKVWFYNCDKKGHYEKECKEKKKGKGMFHASTVVEDETP